MWLARGLSEEPLIMALGLVSSACTGFLGILVCLDAHLPRPGGRWAELEFPTGQENLTALRTGEGGGEGVWGVGGYWEEGQKLKFL